MRPRILSLSLLLTVLLGAAACQGEKTVQVTVAVTATPTSTATDEPAPATSPAMTMTATPTTIPTTPPTMTMTATSTEPPPPANSDPLSFVGLMQGYAPASPVDDGAFAMPAGALPPDHVFEGRLELLGEAENGGFEALQGDSELVAEALHLPEFDYEFVQYQDHLVPTQRGLIITAHPTWNYIIEPGRVWQQEDDQGYSRASFPFALVWKGSNATFNGVMTFLFDDQGVSKVWYQITQETCISVKANFWGLLEAVYHPGPVEDAAQVRDDFAQELADRFPSKPIEQLAVDYPGVDVSAFGRGVSPEHMTYYGFVVNGINYVGGCQTRYGQYAYCESMRAPSYSTAKSMFASVALMRLALKYDPQVPQFLIEDYVPEAADSPGDWSSVTFDHTLDMATGNYTSAGPMVDEEHWEYPFWTEEYYAEKIAAAFDWPHSAPPGTQWVYRTFDTFIVVRAMHNYLQSVEGDEADIFEFVVDEVYKPLKVGPGAHTSLRTRDDNWQGQVYGGYGLWWIPDDVAKIAAFLNNDGGAVNGEQLIPPDLLADALQQDPHDRGVRISHDRQYNNAFWADNFAQWRGYDCDFWVPNMLGYSGNVIALLPNGTTYYYFSDNGEFTYADAVFESEKIVSNCP